MSLLAVLVIAFGCSYDDSGLWKEVDKIKTELKQLRDQITSAQTIVDALSKGSVITGVTPLPDNEGWKITLSGNAQPIEIRNGKPAEVSIAKEGARFYWVLIQPDGTQVFLTDKEGNKIPVTGNDGAPGAPGEKGQPGEPGAPGESGTPGHSPSIAIDSDGFWTIDGERLKDPDGKEVKAQGDSFFKDVRVDKRKGVVVFTLAGGESFTLTIAGATHLRIEEPKGAPYHSFEYGEKTRSFKLDAKGIQDLTIAKQPDGWTVRIGQNFPLAIEVTPPASGSYCSGGIIIVEGVDADGRLYRSSTDVRVADFTDPRGVFVVVEGNMTDSNGMLMYYDGEGREYRHIFRNANPGKTIGNVVQDMFIYKDKVYLITQNGTRKDLGGEGRLVICDLKTMKMLSKDALDIPITDPKANGAHAWPQHLIVTSPTQIFIQYGSSDYERTGGMREITLADDKVTKISEDIEGTYGLWTKENAIKARMILSKGKIYFAHGHGVSILDPTTSKVIKTVKMEGRQCKDVVKGANGNLFAFFAGTFTGNMQWGAQFTSNPLIVELDKEGNIIDQAKAPAQITLPIATWSPNIGACASFTDPYLYFRGTSDFNSYTAARYNYETDTFDSQYIITPYVNYGYMGVDKYTGKLWIGTSKDYTTSTVFNYTVGDQPAPVGEFFYGSREGASPAGVDFYYRFTNEWINK